MFLESRVLPTPLGPSRTRFRPSRRNSRERARSISGRSIFLGQFQSKSAIGLKAPSRLLTRRRSRERRERSAASLRTISSSRARGARPRSMARARRSSRAAAVAARPRALSSVARSLIAVLRLGCGELVVAAESMRLDVQGGELGTVGEIDRQGRLTLSVAAVLFDQVLDGGEGWSGVLEDLLERSSQEVGAVEREQLSQSVGQTRGVAMAREGRVEEAFDFGDRQP